jgi:hypothetical protein
MVVGDKKVWLCHGFSGSGGGLCGPSGSGWSGRSPPQGRFEGEVVYETGLSSTLLPNDSSPRLVEKKASR